MTWITATTNNMRFTTSAIAAVAIAAYSANLGEGRGKLLDSNVAYKRRGAFRTFLSNAKPMWDEMKDPSTDLRSSMPDEEHECDLDVGILGCRMDQVCVPSPQSKRGGLCQSILWEQNSRELQDNATLPTLPDGNSTDPPAQVYFAELCQKQYLTCDCTYFDSVTLEGEISCTEPERCDSYDPTLCLSSTFTYTFLSGSVVVSYCAEANTERFCYSADITTFDYKCLSASMNGCECGCEVTTVGCNANETSGVLFSCPNNVISDGCNGLADLFGNKVESCDITLAPTNITATSSPTQSPITLTASPTLLPTTLTPSKPATGAPIVAETKAPSSTTKSDTPAPTSSSGTNFNSCCQVAFVVITMTGLVSYWV